MTRRQRLSFEACLTMMRRRDPATQEAGYHALLPVAAEHLPRLIAAFREELDHGIRCWLLELIAAARSPEAFPLLAAQLASPDEALRVRAIAGLRALDTPGARRALFEAGVPRE